MRSTERPATTGLIAIVVTSMALLPACAGRTPPAAPATVAAGPMQFASPRAAVDALLAACRSGDPAQLIAIVGTTHRDLVSSGDPSLDRERCARFEKAAATMTRFDPWGSDRLVVAVGTDDYPLPIPLVKVGDAWRFDADAGAGEVLRRQVGRNELEAIGACRSYVRLQKQYAHGNRGRLYASRLISQPGSHDGLLAAGTINAGPATPWHGYDFKILTAQGVSAPSGARSYLKNGRLAGGFALVAYPAAYRQTGVMTFIVGVQGIVYQKDLGPDTAALAAAMTSYDPDSTWQAAAP